MNITNDLNVNNLIGNKLILNSFAVIPSGDLQKTEIVII